MALQDKQALTILDYFASGLARTGSIERAAATLGHSPEWGRARFTEICTDLGVPVDPADEVDLPFS